MTDKVPSSFGRWHVTTEGDVEGRSTNDLGVHDGHIDDIAFRLAGRAGYSLHFSAAEELPEPSSAKEVTISFGSGFRNVSSLSTLERGNFAYDLFKGRPVRVKDSSFYGSVTLVRGKSDAEADAEIKEVLKRQALSKLSEAEKKALGLS